MNTKDVCKKLDITVKSLRIYEQYGIVIPKEKKIIIEIIAMMIYLN